MLVWHKGDAVYGEAALQGRHLEELVEDDLGVGIPLHVHDDAHALTAGLIVYVADALQLAFLHQVGDILNELLLVHAIRYLRDHYAVVALIAFNLGLGANHHAATASGISVFHALQTIYISSCWEVGRWYVLHQSFHVDVGIVNIGTATINHLAKVVGRYVCRHAHGNAVAAIDEQVWYLRRHHGWLLQRVVEVVCHVDGVLVDIVHDVLTHLREAALGVTHGGRGVAIYATKVSLAIHELVAHVPFLSHAHEGSIDGTVSVWVVFTKHLTHDTRAFLIRFVTCVAKSEHTIEYAAVDRLEAVPDIGKGTSYDNRH